MAKIYIKTYGCSANQSDSEIMAGILEKDGYLIVSNEREADVIIINTCIVKSPTEEKVRHEIERMAREHPDKKLIVAGCMAEAMPEKILEIAPKAALISPFNIHKISLLVKKLLEGRVLHFLGKKKIDKVLMPRKTFSKVIFITQISSGCLGNCSYCAVKLAKGPLHSFPIEKIVKEVSIAKQRGFKEIWLTSQDTACYGFEKGKSLPELIKEICERVRGKYFLRIGMMNPKHVKSILDELVEVYDYEQVFKFLHLPIQSASDKVLEEMNRGYTKKDVLEIIRKFRKRYPKITIWTDVIAGYPTEDEKDFKETLNFLEEVRFDNVFVSKFGARPKTEAKKLKPLPSQIVKERSRILSSIARKISLEKNREWINWEGEVLVDEKVSDYLYKGRNYAYKCFIIKSKEEILGRFVRVRGEKASFGGIIASTLL